MILTVTSHKGGAGKTVTAIHLGAYFAQRFGEGSTVVVDTDPNGSALSWASRAESRGYRLPFSVVRPEEERERYEHVIFDSPGRLYGEELEAVGEVSDLVVVPSPPDALAVDALAAFIRDFEGAAEGANYRVLLTMVPWWNRSGPRARRELKEVGLPMFEGTVRFRPAFHTAALEGVPVHEIKTRGAQQAWEDYQKVGEEASGTR